MSFWDRLLVAPLAPMNNDGELNLKLVERYAAVLISRGAEGFYLCGSTGEGVLLTVQERMSLVQRWVDVIGNQVPVVVHVGDTSIRNACDLAEHAGTLKVTAISSMGPLYPGVPLRSMDDLVRWSATIAASVPQLPFFHYHMGALAGMPRVRMSEYVKLAVERIPNFTGVKFTHEDLMDFSHCLRFFDGRYALLYGKDEMLLPAMACGAKGFVGGSYNLTSPLAVKIIQAHQANSLDKARSYQSQLQDVIALVQRHGGMPALKAAMGAIGLDLGGIRQPWRGLDHESIDCLIQELEQIWPDVGNDSHHHASEPSKEPLTTPTITAHVRDAAKQV